MFRAQICVACIVIVLIGSHVEAMLKRPRQIENESTNFIDRIVFISRYSQAAYRSCRDKAVVELLENHVFDPYHEHAAITFATPQDYAQCLPRLLEYCASLREKAQAVGFPKLQVGFGSREVLEAIGPLDTSECPPILSIVHFMYEPELWAGLAYKFDKERHDLATDQRDSKRGPDFGISAQSALLAVHAAKSSRRAVGVCGQELVRELEDAVIRPESRKTIKFDLFRRGDQAVFVDCFPVFAEYCDALLFDHQESVAVAINIPSNSVLEAIANTNAGGDSIQLVLTRDMHVGGLSQQELALWSSISRKFIIQDLAFPGADLGIMSRESWILLLKILASMRGLREIQIDDIDERLRIELASIVTARVSTYVHIRAEEDTCEDMEM